MQEEKKKTSPVLIVILIILPLVTMAVRWWAKSHKNPYENGFMLPDYSDMPELAQLDSTLYIFDDFSILPFDDEDNMNYFEPLLKDCDSVQEYDEENDDGETVRYWTYYWGESELWVHEDPVSGKYVEYCWAAGNKDFELKNGLGIGSSTAQILDFFDYDHDPSKVYTTIGVMSVDTSEADCELYFHLSNGTTTGFTFTVMPD